MITNIALILSMLGSFLISCKDKNGFYVWIISNILWFYDSINRYDIQQAFLWIFYLCNCIIGLYIWNNK